MEVDYQSDSPKLEGQDPTSTFLKSVFVVGGSPTVHLGFLYVKGFLLVWEDCWKIHSAP